MYTIFYSYHWMACENSDSDWDAMLIEFSIPLLKKLTVHGMVQKNQFYYFF